jgi:hypothetical protein
VPEGNIACRTDTYPRDKKLLALSLMVNLYF